MTTFDILYIDYSVAQTSLSLLHNLSDHQISEVEKSYAYVKWGGVVCDTLCPLLYEIEMKLP